MFMLPRAIVVAVVLTVVKEAFGSRTGIHKELYTTNAICRRHYCVNPIFPGLEDLHSLSQAKWVAASLQEAQPTMNFCKGAVNYNPAVPAPNGGAGAKLADLIK